MQIVYIGLGKMGKNMALRMKEKGHEVFCYNRSEDGRIKARAEGLQVFDTLKEALEKITGPKFVFVMVSHQGVDEVLNELLPMLSKGDTVVDGGNCFFKDTLRRTKEIESIGIDFMDIGVSGGPGGARNGACIMIGGKKEVAEKYTKLYDDLSAQVGDKRAWKILGENGAGHFAKMVHNGIEYGMMQSIGEGFNIIKNSDFKFNLKDVAELYNSKSVIDSRLVSWLQAGFEKYGEDLEGISGEVSASGEGEWTVNTAKEKNLPVPAIETSLYFRKMSKGNPTYLGKILSTMRNMFGGHEVGEKKE